MDTETFLHGVKGEEANETTTGCLFHYSSAVGLRLSKYRFAASSFQFIKEGRKPCVYDVYVCYSSHRACTQRFINVYSSRGERTPPCNLENLCRFFF